MRLVLIIAFVLAALGAGSYFLTGKLPLPSGLSASPQQTAQASPSHSALPSSAHDLKLCNDTTSRIGVSIGYKDTKEGWTSEGWWNVPGKSCDVLIQDKLKARFYYIYAIDYDRGGEWGGAIQMCTDDNEFTIRGLDNCEGRGYKRTGFFEVDTQEQTGWTVKLTEQGEASNAGNASADAAAR
jgi:uncharacterized membrane protein